MTARGRRSAQKTVSRKDILDMLATPDSFISWLQGQAPDTEVGSLYTPTNTVLDEYLWAMLAVFAMSADSIVWDGGIIDSADMPPWVQSFNQVEARHMKAVPDDKLTWTASEALAMVREVISSDDGSL